MVTLQQHVNLLDEHKKKAKELVNESLSGSFQDLIEIAIENDSDKTREATRELYIEFMESAIPTMEIAADSAAQYADMVIAKVSR